MPASVRPVPDCSDARPQHGQPQAREKRASSRETRRRRRHVPPVLPGKYAGVSRPRHAPVSVSGRQPPRAASLGDLDGGIKNRDQATSAQDCSAWAATPTRVAGRADGHRPVLIPDSGMRHARCARRHRFLKSPPDPAARHRGNHTLPSFFLCRRLIQFLMQRKKLDFFRAYPCRIETMQR